VGIFHFLIYPPKHRFIRHLSAKLFVYPPLFSLYFVPFFSPDLLNTCLSVNCSKSLSAVLSDVSQIT